MTADPNDLHPVEALLLVALAVAWAVRELVIHAAALALLLARWTPRASAAQAPATAPHAPLPGPALAPAAVPAARTAPATLTQPGEIPSPIRVMPAAQRSMNHSRTSSVVVSALRMNRVVASVTRSKCCACATFDVHSAALMSFVACCLSHTGRRADLLLALPMAW
jgi:hypothetical protein